MDAPTVGLLWEIAAAMLRYLAVVAVLLLGLSVLRSL